MYLINIKNEKEKVMKYHPQNNLLLNKMRIEDEIAISFAKYYLMFSQKLHSKSKKSKTIVSREVCISGYGIADIVTISWDPSKGDIDDLLHNTKEISPTIRAFEVKVSNWRKALTQAYRYRYFANSSIIVLPTEKLRTPLKYLDTFRKIKVGLWGFDKNKNLLKKIFTPKISKPLSKKYYNNIFSYFSEDTKSQLFV